MLFRFDKAHALAHCIQHTFAFENKLKTAEIQYKNTSHEQVSIYSMYAFYIYYFMI
jgi:hypothetical protein